MLAIVIVAFVGLIFFQWGMNIRAKIRGEVPKDVIGKVSNEEIKVKEYIESVRQLIQQVPGTPTSGMIDSMRTIAWQEMIAERIYGQIMAKEGLRITTDEIKEIIKSNPPPEIANMPELRNEKGEFDFQKYHQLLRDRRNIAWVLDYEMRIRKEYPKRKVNIALATAGWITPGEANILTRIFSIHFTGYIFSFPTANYVAQLDTSPEALLAYYNQTLDQWKRPERRQCQYVFFPKIPSKSDSNDLIRRKEELEEDLKAEIDFQTLALQYTNDPRIGLAFDELTGDLKKRVGRVQIGKIISVDQGDQIVYLKRTSKDSVQRIVLEVMISPQTLYDLHDRMTSFIASARDNGFEKACKEYGIKPNLTYPFEKEKVNFQALRDPNQLARFSFKAKLNDLSDPLVGEGGYYIFHLYTISPATTISFEKLQYWLKNRYIKDKALKAAEKRATDFYNRVRAQEKIEDLLKDFPEIEKSRIENQPLSKMKLRYGTETIGSILGMERAGISRPITSGWEVYIALVEKIDQKSPQEAFNYITRLRQLRAEFIFNKTLESFDIEDYRTYEIE